MVKFMTSGISAGDIEPKIFFPEIILCGRFFSGFPQACHDLHVGKRLTGLGLQVVA